MTLNSDVHPGHAVEQKKRRIMIPTKATMYSNSIIVYARRITSLLAHSLTFYNVSP